MRLPSAGVWARRRRRRRAALSPHGRIDPAERGLVAARVEGTRPTC